MTASDPASADTSVPAGPDLEHGVPLASVPATGVLAGHVGEQAVLLARLDDGLYAVSATCTHYGGPLAEGLVVGEEVRCPWHHACFSLRTGAALRAPAFAALSTWRVEVVGDAVFVRAGMEAEAGAEPQTAETVPPIRSTTRPMEEATNEPANKPASGLANEPANSPARGPARPAIRPDRSRDGAAPEHIVILGGGAAGYAAALRLRELGHAGSVTMLSADASAPYDRPNLSKDYLAGTASEDWIPLQDPAFYGEHDIDLQLGCAVTAIDTGAGEVLGGHGKRWGYDALLIATGAEPRRLPVPGFDRPNVFVLRSLADANAVIAATRDAASVALVGAGFIGLEAAGALRARGLDVHVIAPEQVPMARVIGPELGRFIVGLHEAKGVVFHLGATVRSFDGQVLTLADGSRVAADVLLVGAGVAPRTGLAEAAGMAVDNGILVDACLQTSVPGHFAAGDVARYPYGAGLARVEHWVHAQRQGQAAAANLLGAGQAFTDVPFFWTHHQGVELRYTGYAAGWDEVRIDGEPSRRDFIARYYGNGALVAAASVGRDRESLAVEAQLQGPERSP